MDRSLTIHMDLEAPVAPVVLGLVVLGRVARVAPVVLGLVVLGRVARVGPVDLMDRAVLAPVVLDRADPAPGVLAPVVLDRADPAPGVLAPVVLDRADPVDLMARAVLVVRMDRAAPVGVVVPVDRHRLRMYSKAATTVVVRNWVVRGTHRTASALQVMARRHLRPRTDSGGMAGLRLERRHPTGTGHRLPVVGTVRRPPAAGIRPGMDRHTISVGARRTMARSTTTASTPHRSSTRCSVAGASGTSVHGSRCTDLSPA